MVLRHLGGPETQCRPYGACPDDEEPVPTKISPLDGAADPTNPPQIRAAQDRWRNIVLEPSKRRQPGYARNLTAAGVADATDETSVA